MDILKESVKYQLEIEKPKGEIRLIGTGVFKDISAWPVNDQADVVWVRFFPDGEVEIHSGYGGGSSGNTVVSYRFEGFFNALMKYPSLKKEVENLKEEVNDLKRDIENSDEDIVERNEKIFDLARERSELFNEMKDNIEKLSILSGEMKKTYEVK